MTIPTRTAKRVLLVGWDGADWATVQNLMNAEGLPNLAALLRSGAGGQLVATRPRIVDTQWTALITGQRAHKHGVLHASEPLSSNRGVRRVTRPSIRTATLGAILSASGLTVNQVAWPVSHPAENLHGVVVSNHFASEARPESINKSGGWPWVTPRSAAAEIFARRTLAEDVEEVALAQLAPTRLLAHGSMEHLQRICRLAIAEMMTIYRATNWCMDATQWDCTLSMFPVLRRLTESLKKLPPDGRSEEVKATVLKGCYEYLDMLLGQLVASAGEDATVVLTSMGRTGAVSPLVFMRGPKVQPGPLSPAASVLDVTPTLLTMLDIPVAADMDGRAWTNLIASGAPDEPHYVETHYVETWNSCVHPPRADAEGLQMEADAPADPAVAHLLELGYVDPLETAAREKAELCRRETERNRALSLLDAGQVDEAASLLRELQAQHPLWTSPYELLAEIHVQRGEYDEAAQELEFLIHHGAESARLYLVLGKLALARRELPDAAEHFHVAERITSNLRGLQLAQATARLRRREFEAAEQAFRRSQIVDGPSAAALDGLAACSLATGQHERAADFALAALEQDMRFAKAHYHLGVALVQLGRLEDAKRVFEASAAVDPQFVAPLRWLVRLCRDNLQDSQQAEAYRARGREIIRDRRRARHRAIGSA